MYGSKLICLAIVALGLPSADAATKHYSFASGYPTTTGRQPSSATTEAVGVGATTGADRTKKIEEKTFVGVVTRIDSGDVIWVTPTGGRRTKILFADTDAPEQGQNFGVEAKKFVFDLVNGKEVTIRYYAKDPSGAIRGTVMLKHGKGLVDVNLTLIKNGCAWHVETARPVSTKAETSRTRAYAAAEADARSAHRGLWAAPNPVKPSEWRKLHRTDGRPRPKK